MIRIRHTFGNQHKSCDFDASEVIVGRHKAGLEIDLDLTPDLAVSRPHARLWIEGDQYWIEDLGSRYGITVDGETVQGPSPVAPGVAVQLGHTTLYVGEDFANPPLPNHHHDPDEGLEIRHTLDANRPAFSAGAVDSSESARRLALIYELPLQFAVETQWDALLQTIVRCLVEVIPDAARCTLLLRDRNGDELVLAASYPVTAGVSMTLARRAMDERHGFIWRRAEEGDISQSIITYGIETGMYAPLLWQDRALGAVCVDNPGRTSVFSNDDLRLLLMIAQYAAMAVANQQLQQDLREAWTGSLDALTSALASRDNDTQSHCFRTVELSVELARRMGISENDIPTIARGALLHDIGKIGISDTILFKPAGLTVEERNIMKQHVRLGYDMLHHIGFFHDALPVVLYHHEEYDGTGYPEGLVGENIPQSARIFHVVDSYDALTQQRPYKLAWSHEETIAELRKFAGVKYDPDVVRVLEELSPEVTERIRTLRAFSPATRVLLGRAFTRG